MKAIQGANERKEACCRTLSLLILFHGIGIDFGCHPFPLLPLITLAIITGRRASQCVTGLRVGA